MRTAVGPGFSMKVTPLAALASAEATQMNGCLPAPESNTATWVISVAV